MQQFLIGYSQGQMEAAATALESGHTEAAKTMLRRGVEAADQARQILEREMAAGMEKEDWNRRVMAVSEPLLEALSPLLEKWLMDDDSKSDPIDVGAGEVHDGGDG